MQNPKLPIIKIVATLVLAAAVMAILLLMQEPSPTVSAAPPAGIQAGADLTVEISVVPVVPDIGQEATINLVIKNVGSVDAVGQFKVFLYEDPTDRPPTPATVGFPIATLPGLNAGMSAGASRTHTFTTGGCDHIIYAWVDRDNSIPEDNENNNLIALPVCVGVACAVDQYEQDNSCSVGAWLTENGAQAHSFCNAVDKNLPDEDWVKFTAFTGVTYTLAASNAGVHANPRLTLYNSCGSAPLSSPVANLTWQAPGSGVYYAKLESTQPNLGPLTAYSLTLVSTTGVTDNYEPDNHCATARDITTDGVRQAHLFQTPTDEDWVKFTIQTGENFIVLADHTSTGVNPVITLFNSCNQAAVNESLGVAAQQVTENATTAQVYYARVTNQNSTTYGANAHYDLAVTASACVADDLEPDNNVGQAKMVTVGAAAQTHNFCPARDEDWVKFNAEAGKIYVLQTENLAFAADTVLQLYGTDGSTELAQNDDYNYVSASRIVFQPPAAGVYYPRIRHVNLIANGPNTQYDFSIQEGFCQPDAIEGNHGDNGSGDAAPLTTDGAIQSHNFCADPLNMALGDQDWVKFTAVADGTYHIQTTDLAPNSDTVLQLYNSDGATLLQANDDAGAGRSANIQFHAPTSGDYFVRIVQYNSNIVGSDTNYQVRVLGEAPPTPTFTPTPTLPPPPTPTPTVAPTNIKTLILVNRARLETLYGAAETNTLMDRLANLADHARVQGAVIQVENDAAVAAAYAAWTADANALADNDKANAVSDAIRNRVMSFLDNGPNVRYLIIIGGDWVIPFRRVLDQVQAASGGASASGVIEHNYADVSPNTSVAAALAANMVLTDDYYADRQPEEWEDRQHNKYPLYIPDYAVSRLVETPTEIRGMIDQFFASQVINTNKVLVTGYDFVQDSAQTISGFFKNDTLTTDDTLIAPLWLGDDLRTRQLNANPRFDVQSINGHSTHLAISVPDKKNIQASEIVAASSDLAGALIYSMGCHSGLNDPGVLDLAQAFMQRHAYYVGNTGFGWGGSGSVYSEALMRNYTRELLRDLKAEIGPALRTAKQKYRSQATAFNAYDAKVLMQATFYGLPMVEMTSGATFGDDDPFPSAQQSFSPPTAFGAVNVGTVSYALPQAFGAFGDTTTNAGRVLDLDHHTAFAADEPVQPGYFTNVTAPSAGQLRGAVFLGGVYSDVVAFNPVIALADNEYVTDKIEPTFTSDSWFPALPFDIRNSAALSATTDTVVMSLGQFRSLNNTNGVERVFSQMALNTYYSNLPDLNAAEIRFVDGVLDPAAGKGQIKVETFDASGVQRVVVAFTTVPTSGAGQGVWQSQDLSFAKTTQKWTGVITATAATRYFIQVVDGAGNVAVNDNKGRYYPLLLPLPLVQGRTLDRRIYLPVITR